MARNQDRPIIEPGRGPFEVKVSERVLFLPAGPSARLLAARFLARKKRIRPYPARVYRLRRQGVEIDIVGPAMGAPMAAMVLEQLIAGGAKKIIALGVAGSIDPELCISELLLVNEAISDEGTSRNYFPDRYPPLSSEPLLIALKTELERSKENFKIGKVVSTDGFFRETKSKLENYQKQSAVAVEMELSALFTIARCRGVDLAAAVVISDELWSGEWKPGFKSPSLALKLSKAGEIALSVLAK